MIELYLSKNNLENSAAYGKYYPRVSYKQTLNIHDMAKHMAEHNTPFSEGTIEGILRDFVKCTRGIQSGASLFQSHHASHTVSGSL